MKVAMKVVEIRGHHLRATLPEPIGNALGFVTHRATLLVEVETDRGLVGWGECWHAPGGAAGWIRDAFAEVVLGVDPLDRWPLWQAMHARAGYDRSGTAVMALGALDLALWDVAGRAAGMPVWRLLGGRLRDRATAYASGPFLAPGADPYAEFPRQVERYLERGFRAIKPRAGVHPAADGAMAGRLRAQVGPEVALMLDFNQGYGVAGAMAAAEAVCGAGLAWIEEPLAPDDHAGYAALAARSRVPLAAGEALAGLAAFRDALAPRALGVLQPDLAVCGGLTAGLGVQALAAAHGVPVVPHVWGSVVNACAALQWIATLPGLKGPAAPAFPLFEWDQTPNPFLDLAAEPLRLERDGSVAIPEGPGLGMEIRRERLAPLLQGSWTVRA